jgi:hypothetical protein
LPPIKCTVFSYAPAGVPPDQGPVFLTAAHCLTGPNGEDWRSGIVLIGTRGESPLYCSAEAVFLSPEDAAVLVCAGDGAAGAATAAGAAALSRSVGGARLGLAVVAAGFVPDAFESMPRFSLPADPLTAMKLTFAHVSNIAGIWNNISCDAAHTGPATTKPWPVKPGGFFNGLVTRGMSGGPLVNLKCEVIGIIHGKGCESSVFASLRLVDEYLLGKRPGRWMAAVDAEAALLAALGPA